MVIYYIRHLWAYFAHFDTSFCFLSNFFLLFLDLNRSNAPALLANSRACDRLQPVQGALAPRGFSGDYNSH